MPHAGYTPQPGREGSAFVGGNTLSVDTFRVRFVANIIRAPSFTGAPYVEKTSGLREAFLEISGTWNRQYNIFAQGIKQGDTVDVVLTLNSLPTEAIFIAWVSEVDIGDEVDGKADMTIILETEWEFNDFSGTLG